MGIMRVLCSMLNECKNYGEVLQWIKQNISELKANSDDLVLEESGDIIKVLFDKMKKRVDSPKRQQELGQIINVIIDIDYEKGNVLFFNYLNKQKNFSEISRFCEALKVYNEKFANAILLLPRLIYTIDKISVKKRKEQSSIVMELQLQIIDFLKYNYINLKFFSNQGEHMRYVGKTLLHILVQTLIPLNFDIHSILRDELIDSLKKILEHPGLKKQIKDNSGKTAMDYINDDLSESKTKKTLLRIFADFSDELTKHELIEQYLVELFKEKYSVIYTDLVPVNIQDFAKEDFKDSKRNNIFHLIIKYEDLEMLNILIELVISLADDKKKDFEKLLIIPNEAGYSPVIYAMQEGKYDIVKILLSSNLAKNIDIDMLLICAINKEKEEIIMPAIENGILKLSRGYNPSESLLEVAIKNNMWKVVNALLMQDCYRDKINTPDSNGDTPLIWAVRVGNESIVNTLLDAGAADSCLFSNAEKDNPISLAIKLRKDSILKKLVEKYQDYEKGYTLVKWIIRDNRIDLLEFLSTTDDSFREKNDMLIELAIINNRIDLLEWLSTIDDSFREKNDMLIERAVTNNKPDVLTWLITKGIISSSTEVREINRLIYFACNMKCSGLTKALLDILPQSDILQQLQLLFPMMPIHIQVAQVDKLKKEEEFLVIVQQSQHFNNPPNDERYISPSHKQLMLTQLTSQQQRNQLEDLLALLPQEKFFLIELVRLLSQLKTERQLRILIKLHTHDQMLTTVRLILDKFETAICDCKGLDMFNKILSTKEVELEDILRKYINYFNPQDKESLALELRLNILYVFPLEQQQQLYKQVQKKIQKLDDPAKESLKISREMNMTNTR